MAGEPKPESIVNSALGGLLYRLTVMFPNWAGVFLVPYTLRVRMR